ncbi:hypothetical protein DXG01_006619 [Tephrocybe rancida]|nr:hypothetical protein DXG01_006619 [Tephrocybe rancida]
MTVDKLIGIEVVPATQPPVEDVQPPPAELDALAELIHQIELTSAEVHNIRMVGRNARASDGNLELLEKIVSSKDVDIATN